MHATRFTARHFMLALALLAIGSGCSSFLGKKTLSQVSQSQLNWLEICYVPRRDSPPIQVTLMGSGFVRIKRGRSPLVSNDFSQDVANVQWSDIETDQINVQPDEIHRIFQSLVDRGLMRPPDKTFAASASRGGPTARILGTLNTDHVVRIVNEPELLGFIRDLITLFDEHTSAAAPK
ncbi:MAG: hypothetical protein WCR06_02230 [bacterium]